MGEATYYAKVVFDTDEQAQKAMPKINKFLKRMAKCDDRWQHIRNEQGSPEARDALLRQEFPDVFKALGIPQPPPSSSQYHAGDLDQSLNYLAGLIDSPANEFGDYTIFVDGNSVKFSGTVWHFAEWDGLMAAMKKKFGAKSAGYVSDEYVEHDYYEIANPT